MYKSKNACVKKVFILRGKGGGVIEVLQFWESGGRGVHPPRN